MNCTVTKRCYQYQILRYLKEPRLFRSGYYPNESFTSRSRCSIGNAEKVFLANAVVTTTTLSALGKPWGPFGVDRNFAVDVSKSTSRRDIQRRWGELVMACSTKSLTYRSDVFPAIQAMAKLVPSNMGRYLAGHWESILIPSLCWSAYPWASDKHRKWYAPSWSWAAAQREVHWRSRHDSSLKTSATLINALTVPAGDDPTGQISFASITLRGEVLAGEIRTAGNPSGLSLILEGHRVDIISGWRVHWDTICHDQVGKRVFALKLFELDVDSRYQCWLVLQAAEGKQDEYVRIGLLCMDNSPPERHNYMYWSNIDAEKGATDVKRYKYTCSRALGAMDAKKVETDVKII